jgi:hypothetical protein
MADVRRIVAVVLAAHAAGLAILAGLLRSARARPPVARGLRSGALLMLGLALLVGVAVATNAVGFLTAFHGVVFAGDTWRDSPRTTRSDACSLTGSGATPRSRSGPPPRSRRLPCSGSVDLGARGGTRLDRGDAVALERIRSVASMEGHTLSLERAPAQLRLLLITRE